MGKGSKHVAVIGAGLGGISSAIMLAKKGYRVSLLEKNSHLGGKLNRLETGGFKFDLGPSIFTLPQYFRPLFEGDGKRLEDYVDLVRVDPQWRNFFEDGQVVDLWENEDRMRSELERFGGDAYADYRAFLRYSKKQYDLCEKGYFAKAPDDLWQFIRAYKFFGAFGIDYAKTMSQSISERVREPHLRSIFEYFIKYVGSSANASPGFMNLMPNIQFEFGLWYVQGGLYKLAEALERRLAEVSVDVQLDTEVVGMKIAGPGVSGVKISRAGGERRTIEVDAVVSNMEVIPCYEKLLGDQATAKSLEKFEPACSGIVLHLGTKKIYPQLAHHNFFYSRNQTAHFEKVFTHKQLPDDPTIYLVAPTRSDPSQAPPGHDNIKILPHIPYINDKSPFTYEDCVRLKDRVIDKLERMGLTDLRKNTVVEDFWTPFDIEKKYYSNKGSIYGVVSDLKKNFAFKAPKKSHRYENLYFVGGSVNPGGGMPMVVLCGQHVANLVEREVPSSR